MLIPNFQNETRQARKTICGGVLSSLVLQTVYKSFSVCVCVCVFVCHNATQMFHSLHLYLQRHVPAWDGCQHRKSPLTHSILKALWEKIHPITL